MGPLLVQPDETPQLGIVAFHDAGATPLQFQQAFATWRSVLPPALLYAPRAPLPSDPALGGFEWYSLDGIDEHNRVERLGEGVDMARGLLQRFASQFKLAPRQVVAAGYSQGAVLLLGLADEAGDAYFGQLLSFAGQPLPAEMEAGGAVRWPRVALFHGEQDDVVPAAYARALFDWLGERGARPGLFLDSAAEHRLEQGMISKAGEQVQRYYAQDLKAPAC